MLKRELHFWDAVAIGTGIIIGVGIFRVPSEVAKHLHSPTLILFAWLVGGLIAHAGALCYAELASRYPETGGTYIFLRESYGRLVGFLFGWTEIAILRAGSIAAVAYVFSTYLRNFIPLAAWQEKFTAILAIVLLTQINVSGLKQGTRVQNVLSSLKVFNLFLMSVVILGFGLKMGAGHIAFALQNVELAQAPSLLSFAPALVPILWTYGGWHESAFMSGEFKDTKKALPISMLASTLVVTILYLLINAAYLTVLTPDEMTQNKAIASVCFERLFGPVGSAVVTIAVLISAFGALNSTIMTGGRIPFAIAQDHPKFSWASGVHEQFGTPHGSLIINGVWAAVLVLLGTFEQLLFFCQFAQWLFFGLAGVSIFIARKKQGTMETFSMFGYPFVPALFVATSLAICLSIVWYAPVGSLVGVGLILLGIPVYGWMNEK